MAANAVARNRVRTVVPATGSDARRKHALRRSGHRAGHREACMKYAG